MPLPSLDIDSRRYQDLLDEALARVPVHTPEWTNFNKGDPGVTLVELFAFLTESLLYRANQIPDRNHRKFLSLLGVPLQAATPASGLVAISNDRGLLQTVNLDRDLEVRAGAIPFRTERGLDVLPIEAQVYYKRKPTTAPAQQVSDYYAQLYASYGTTGPNPANLALYETTPLPAPGIAGVDLGQDTVDGCLWVAILARAVDHPADASQTAREALHEYIRSLIAGRTLSIGFVPWLQDPGQRVTPGGAAQTSTRPLLQFWLPAVPEDGLLPADPALRVASYRQIVPAASDDILTAPGIVDLTLPAITDLRMWTNLAPLESGVGNFPPALDDTTAEARVITWLCLNVANGADARFVWAGINTTPVRQRAHVADEQPPPANGEPDQIIHLARGPLIEGSVQVTITPTGRPAEQWARTDDLLAAGPEVPVPDLRLPPGTITSASGPSNVFAVDAEAGTLRFGDGTHGARPRLGATLRVSYDYGVGAAGNVPAGAINVGPALPAGLRVVNPVRTWGGADSESIEVAEREIPRFLQHRDRLVTADDFASIAWRTPGVALGRVEVLAAFDPRLSPANPGDSPGAVTVMVIPQSDPVHPDAPVPDQAFLEAVCAYLDQRRLITTELFVRPPTYVDVWISVGIDIVPGAGVVDVCAAVKQALLDDLSPIAWPLTRTIVGRELMAVAGRTPGVRLVRGEVLVGLASGPPHDVPMSGLQLPRVAGISVVAGDPIGLDQLRVSGTAVATGGLTPGSGGPASGIGGVSGGLGQGTGTGTTGGVLLPIPTIPAECR